MTWDEPFKLMIVDDESERLAQHLAEALEPAGFKTTIVRDVAAAQQVLAREPVDFLVLSFNGQGALNLQPLQSWLSSLTQTRTVALLSESLESYEDLLHQAGVGLIIPRRLNPRQIAQTLINQGELRNLEEQNHRLRQMVDTRTAYENLLGGSAPMRAMYRLLDQIARTDAPVLITGEDGTERVDVARAIHQKSERAQQPLVAIDCRKMAEDRTGAAVFGPLGNGSYSTGPSLRHSAFARAGKGAIVLHNIETMPPEVQRRLVDFFHRPFFQNETPGSPQPLARIMATAGPNLLGKVEAGEFQRELFYRLNILQVRVPPLRERREDIPMLAQHFLRAAARRLGVRATVGGLTFSSKVLLRLFQYDWPENLEELERTVAEMATHAQDGQLEVENLPPALQQLDESANGESIKLNGKSTIPLKEAKRLFETEYFTGLLRRTHGNMAMASRYSHVGRPYLYKKIREYGIEPEEFR